MNQSQQNPEQILRKAVQTAPDQSGLYFFWGENYEPLYIGKSEDIQNRLRSHLREYRDCEKMREQVDYDDLEMEEFAISRYADQEIHANMNEVIEITTKTVDNYDHLEKMEKRFIRAFLPKYNTFHKHISINTEILLACPECENRLEYKKTAGANGGYVCRNSNCRHYWKLNKGDVIEIISTGKGETHGFLD